MDKGEEVVAEVAEYHEVQSMRGSRPGTDANTFIQLLVGIVATALMSYAVFPLKGTKADYLYGLINERIKPVHYNGAECTTEAVIRGDYTLARPVYLLTRGDPSPAVAAFIAYVLSPEGQSTIRESGLIPAK